MTHTSLIISLKRASSLRTTEKTSHNYTTFVKVRSHCSFIYRETGQKGVLEIR